MHGEEGQVVQQPLQLAAAGRVPDAQGALAQRQAVPGAHGRVRQRPPDAADSLANKGTNNGSLRPLHPSVPEKLRQAQTCECKNEPAGQGQLAD